MKKKFIIVNILCIVFALLIIVFVFNILSNTYKQSATAIQVIGGADGPTAIFLAGTGGFNILWLFFIAIAIIIALLIIKFAKSKK